MISRISAFVLGPALLWSVSTALAEGMPVSRLVETIVQQKLRPGLCAVNPDKPLQYGEMAWLLPRGDAAFKGWMDQWFHLA